ncbi:MAG: radical SAM protein, partial [Chloroflexota bacterium]
HPNYMTDKILHAVADLPKVMPQIEVPIQAGNNKVLKEMKREYTREEYTDLVGRIRAIVPDAAINCDIIVGFPNETDEEFQETFDLLEELRIDKIHLARYSPRPGTPSAYRYEDNVPDEEKRRRFQVLEEQHRRINHEKNQKYLGTVQEVLVEGMQKGRWRGRNPQGKLVFLTDPRELKGHMVQVKIDVAGPWSLSGEALDKPAEEPVGSPKSIELTVL